ncbi:LPS export ABC transporter periplasmic protein LptC [Chromohalobacter israelensis]|uniref:LPS export ABC transporter periplasmic protein LptC n=1 Tax=Chromohalobacter israelensis TaxID=141390 RepID=UPI001CC4376A|nr:LPS export ABC transporter periplasmic protein LptC [Chromohalobacter salexigens]MBZ5874656.1 LPS export ABC transporter periplasmic protein LptC [Chromohalobacter salexigens]
MPAWRRIATTWSDAMPTFFSSRKWTRFALLLILVVLGIGLAIVEQRNATTPGPVPSDDAGEPDYYLEGVTMTRFDAQGIPHQTLTSPRLVHTPKDDIIRAASPVAKIRDADGRQWDITGDKGRLGAQRDLLTLTGNAQLVQPEQGWRLNTDVLHYQASEAHAWSDSDAVLRQHEQRVRGNRFDAWLDTDRARLTGDVQGHHPQIAEDDT